MRSLLAIALISLAFGCSASDKQQREQPAPEAQAAEAEAADPAQEAGAEAPAGPSREQRAAQAIERVAGIQTALAELRGMPFKQSVPAEHQSQDDFRKFVEAEIQKELPPDKARSLEAALYHIGLLPEKLDLVTTLEDALVSQAGAYYDPATEKFYLVMVPENDMMLDTISSHELMHALQDQHFDLDAYYQQGAGAERKLDEDQLNARRFIVEGEATMMMLAYAPYSLTQKSMLEKDMLGTLRTQLSMMANMDIEQLVQMTKAQAAALGQMDPEMQKSLEAMDDIPLYILVPLLDSYMKGALPVLEAYAQGGWDAVAALYTTRPPTSTEQVLHPAQKLVGKKRDEPTRVTLPSLKQLSAYEEVQGDVLGELLWRVYFMNWGGDPNAAAAGWDGDRYAVYAKDGHHVGLLATTWDSPAEAKEFTDAYLASLAKRFPDGEAKALGAARAHARGADQWTLVQHKGKDVFIVEGGDEAMARSLLDKLARHTKKQGG